MAAREQVQKYSQSAVLLSDPCSDYKYAASDVSFRVVQADAEVGLVPIPGKHNTKGTVR